MKKEPTFDQLMTMLHLELEASIVEDLEVRLRKIMEDSEKELVEHIKACAKEQSCSMCKEFLGKVTKK